MVFVKVCFLVLIIFYIRQGFFYGYIAYIHITKNNVFVKICQLLLLSIYIRIYKQQFCKNISAIAFISLYQDLQLFSSAIQKIVTAIKRQDTNYSGKQNIEINNFFIEMWRQFHIKKFESLVITIIVIW